MTTYEAGRESSILQDIINGNKTIEARLARGKFLSFQPGDTVDLREDFYDNGHIVRSERMRAKAEVIKTEKFRSFRDMLVAVGYKNVLPRASSIADAEMQCLAFYSKQEESECGVLAIYFHLLPASKPGVVS